MKVKIQVYRGISLLIISLLLLFSFAQPVYASSASPAVEAGTMISSAEWAENASALLAEALEKYGAMGVAALENSAIVVGSAAFAYAGTKGVEFAVDTSLETAATLGRYIIANVADMDAEIQRTVASVLFNIDADASYYETKSMVYSSQLLTSLDTYLGNYISANTISMNVGLVSQSVIPSSYLEQMTPSIYELYEAMPRPIYAAKETFYFPYSIYSLPVNTQYVLISRDGTTATFLDALGNQVAITGIASSSYWLYYSTLVTPNCWDSSWFTSSSFDIRGYDFDWGGLTVLQGDSYADAMGLVTDYPLGLDLTNILDRVWHLLDDLVVPYGTALDVGTGARDITDVADVVSSGDTATDTDTGTISNILDWLKAVWNIFTDILDAITAIPSAIGEYFGKILKVAVQGDVSLGQATIEAFGEMISDVVTTLFVPSEATVSEITDLLDEKLPLITDLSSWVDDLMKIMQSPEDYASNLTFDVDMSKAENTYWDYGDSSTNAISVSWYMKYKSTVDDIIVGIAWLIFLWNVHCQLPAIISAVSTTTFAGANLEYQKYSVNTRTKKMRDEKSKDGGE